MFDKNENVVDVGDTVKVLLFFRGTIEELGVDKKTGLPVAFITWEMKSGYKYGMFYGEEFVAQ